LTSGLFRRGDDLLRLPRVEFLAVNKNVVFVHNGSETVQTGKRIIELLSAEDVETSAV
jgi:hypothetical protein